MRIISVREHPEYKDLAIAYLQQCWPEVDPVIYQDCIAHCVNAEQPLPQWYLLKKERKPVGCAGLITNDFISRMDLYPWLCAVFIEPAHRGQGYGRLLIDQAKKDARSSGFKYLNLSTELTGYYEKYGFSHIAEGYHPWGAQSKIYQITL